MSDHQVITGIPAIDRHARVIPLDLPPKPENDELANLPEINAADLAGAPLPVRQSHDEKGLIPSQGVTLLFGDGGTGKSLLALQLASSTVLSQLWLGLTVRSGPVYYFSCEDPQDETHIRLQSIAENAGATLADLKGLTIAPMAGRECVLAANDGKGIIKPTPLFEAFEKRIKALRPALVIIDNLIDVFAGNMIDPPQAKQFMHLLSGLSIDCNCPILVLAHPSMTGMNSGSGDGGTRAWSNSSRSRLYLERVLSNGQDGQPIEDDPNARVLTRKKANYAPTGDGIKMRWEGGIFVHEEIERVMPGDTLGAAHKAERVFTHLVRWHRAKGINVSASTGRNYAPLIFSKHPQSEGVSKRAFEKAMAVLLEQNNINMIPIGAASRGMRTLAETSEGTE